MHPEVDVTELLSASSRGDREARERLFSLVYGELRALAHRQLRRAVPGETMNTTALVHEAYLKIARPGGTARDRGHFFAIAARAMRQILVDQARERTAQKRGGGQRLEVLHEEAVTLDARAGEIVALDGALERLAALDERLSHLVELRFFAGLSVEETAEVLSVSDRTVKRDWRKARTFLHHALSPVP